MNVVTIRAFGSSYKIINPGAGRVGSKLANGEPYEKKLLVDVYQHCPKGSAFDIGAHIGNHSLYLAAICGLKVFAWEPHELSREMLMENIKLNPKLDITVFDWGAGDRHTRGRFTSGMWLEFDPTRDGDTIKVDRGHIAIHPIDALVDVPDVSIIKIDVEGMEPDVLRGLTDHLSRSHPIVYAETHTDEAMEETASILTPLGYSLTRVIHMGSPQARWEWQRP